MEQEARESAVSRGQNVVYAVPHGWASITHFLAPLVERIDQSNPGVQVLVVTADAETAASVGAAAVKLAAERGVSTTAATSTARAARLLKIEPAQLLAGPPQILLELVRSTVLKLDGVRAVSIAWADDLLAAGGATALETLMAEIPKEAARTIVAATIAPAVEELIERYARRARRVVWTAAETDAPTAIEYATTSSGARLDALRRLLDELDPKSALVFVRDEDSEQVVTVLLRSLGYRGGAAAVRVGRTPWPEAEVLMLFDLPASREELREITGAATKRIIALVQPRQLTSVRALAAGGPVTPMTLPDATLRARDRDTLLRGEIRQVLQKGEFGRELLALEPLLDEYDGIEIAAAVLQLFERERSAARARPEQAPPAAVPVTGPLSRIFVNVGERDNVRAADLVGAIVNEVGIARGQIGKVDVRESHAIVEVAAPSAAIVIDKLTGVMIRGRRAVARADEERPRRERSESAGGRPQRDRGERGERGERGDRGERGPRGPRAGGARNDRPERRPPRGAPRKRDRE